MDKIFRRDTQADGMTVKKKKNEKNRKRNQILNFRVSPVEKELILQRIDASGLNKSDFFIQSCLYQAILIKGNIRTLDAIRRHLEQIESILNEQQPDKTLDPVTVESIRLILEMMRSDLKKTERIQTKEKSPEDGNPRGS